MKCEVIKALEVLSKFCKTQKSGEEGGCNKCMLENICENGSLCNSFNYYEVSEIIK